MVESRERRQRLAECCSLCEIPVVAVTNYQKLGGLKEHRVTGRSEVWNGVHWAEAKCWRSCTPSRGSRGEFFPAFEASRIHVYSLAHSPSSIFQASRFASSLLSDLWPTAFIIAFPCLTLTLPPLSYKVTKSQVLGIRMLKSLGEEGISLSTTRPSYAMPRVWVLYCRQ